MGMLNPSQLRDARKVASALVQYEKLIAKKALNNIETINAMMLGDTILLAGASLGKHLKGSITSAKEYNQRQWWKPWK